ncbi:bifunctional 4-hydroxy-2-oxoglutarate aldolase/2-dehydro-3-deoxy-phosphogluconate aldolase [Pseudobutyrivibrio ruminis]|nr:bifunctional 4-hydroxy-2-oxoglutarate aldolase/2-dehydro-3-deoxy-phosphogluconate aldolase [Pseudobutyrivibrio ruminis]
MINYMNDILTKFESIKVVPVVVIDNIEDVVPLANALINGGLPIAEVTFRTSVASDAIKLMVDSFPEMCVGAGTIINLNQCKKAIESGAQFIVSPGYSEEVVQYCIEQEVPVFPGICTPTELMHVANSGLPVAKFFPASQCGGVETINAIGAAFPRIKFMPTGGVNENNLMEYLACPRVIAVGGSWMVKSNLIREGKFDEIEAMTKGAVALVKNHKR